MNRVLIFVLLVAELTGCQQSRLDAPAASAPVVSYVGGGPTSTENPALGQAIDAFCRKGADDEAAFVAYRKILDWPAREWPVVWVRVVNDPASTPTQRGLAFMLFWKRAVFPPESLKGVFAAGFIQTWFATSRIWSANTVMGYDPSPIQNHPANWVRYILVAPPEPSQSATTDPAGLDTQFRVDVVFDRDISPEDIVAIAQGSQKVADANIMMVHVTDGLSFTELTGRKDASDVTGPVRPILPGGFYHVGGP